MTRFLKLVTFTLSIYLSTCVFSFAEISASVKLMPANPEPKSKVTLTLVSYSFNPDTAFVSWKVNGRDFASGLGKKDITIQTGDIGATTQVSVHAETADGSSIDQVISITPSSVVLLYEAPKSYVPLLYEGRSLPSDGALVRVTALPQLSDNGTPVPPGNLSYTWYLNDTVVKSVSGAGKQSALIRLDYLRTSNEIRVVVRSPLGNTADEKITIYTHSILPILYLSDPLFGTNVTTRIGKRFETTRDFRIVLEPFYISYNDPKEATYSWFINGLPSTPLDGRTLDLHPKENDYGIKKLSIKLYGADKRLQTSEVETEIVFDTRK